MAKKKNINPTENVLAVLQMLWERVPSTGKEVNNDLPGMGYS